MSCVGHCAPLTSYADRHMRMHVATHTQVPKYKQNICGFALQIGCKGGVAEPNPDKHLQDASRPRLEQAQPTPMRHLQEPLATITTYFWAWTSSP